MSDAVDRACDALMRSRLTWGTHADRWGDIEWQRGFWREAAEIVVSELGVAEDA